MKIPRTRFVAAALFAALPLSAATAAELDLRILETTDVHMNLLDYDYYQDQPTAEVGLARTATLIQAARAEAKNSLLFDNGDLLQGTPVGDVVARVQPLREGQIHVAYRVLEALHFDAGNLGNHEFNYGLPFLRRAMQGVSFPIVNANVMDAAHPDRYAFTPYVLLDREFTNASGAKQRLKIGVIGFAPPQIMVWDQQHLTGQVVARDIIETARRLVPELRAQGADLVVAIAHTGIENGPVAPGAENVGAALAQVPGIDVLLLGHQHADFPGPGFAHTPGADIAGGHLYGVPAIMPGRFGDHLGLIDLHLDNATGAWKVSSSTGSLRAIYDRQTRRALVDADPEVTAIVAPEHAATLAYVRAQVAETAGPIFSHFAQVTPSPAVQLVAQAQLAFLTNKVRGTPFAALPLLSAAAPFRSGGNSATDIPAGPLSMKNVADLYVYPNTAQVVKLTGAEVREWLERSAGQFRRIDPAGPAEQELLEPSYPAFNFDTLYGLSYEFDLTQPARYNDEGTLVAPEAHRVLALRYQGRPVDPQASFLVITNNYRASGGGHFPGLTGGQIAIDTDVENRELLRRYLVEQKMVKPTTDSSWRIRPVQGVSMRFTAGAGGSKYLGDVPQVKLVKDLGDGRAIYELAN